MCQDLPSYFKSNGYANVTNETQTPLAKTWKTDLPAYQWYQTKPEFLTQLNTLLNEWERDQRSWLDVYPVELCGLTMSEGQPLMVDIGGGLGHQAIRLTERFPSKTIQVPDSPSFTTLKAYINMLFIKSYRLAIGTVFE